MMMDRSSFAEYLATELKKTKVTSTNSRQSKRCKNLFLDISHWSKKSTGLPTEHVDPRAFDKPRTSDSPKKLFTPRARAIESKLCYA